MLASTIRINGDLRGTPHVRVIGASGEPLGVVSLAAALRLALQAGLDLVEVHPNADPPVCRLMTLAKYPHGERKDASSSRVGAASRRSPPVDVLNLPWIPFDCDGRAFEYVTCVLAPPDRHLRSGPRKTDGADAITGVLVQVRELGDTGALMMVFPTGTEPTVERAIEVARFFWHDRV